MTEKPGFWGRLFRSSKPAPAPQPVEAAGTLPEVIPALEPVWTPVGETAPVEPVEAASSPEAQAAAEPADAVPEGRTVWAPVETAAPQEARETSRPAGEVHAPQEAVRAPAGVLPAEHGEMPPAAEEPAEANVVEAVPAPAAALTAEHGEIPSATEEPAGAAVVEAMPASDAGLPAEPDETPSAAELAAKKSWFQRLRDGLRKTSSKLAASLTALFTHKKLDAGTLEELEDILIQADFGVDTAARITKAIAAGRYGRDISAEEVRELLAAEVEKILDPVAVPLPLESEHRPHVMLVVGVNGAGKTTTIGKLSNDLARAGKSVMLAAGDTFRAAAIEQLKIWGERSGAAVISGEQGADAAGLAFDALRLAREENRDVLIIDTAGRLQNKAHLMAELEKIIRVLKKLDESAPHTVLLTLDATTGQNALNQVEIFSKTAGVTGLIMTKLDGTARGGILVAIAAKYGLPVHAIGVGEGIDDLQTFSAREFARAITGD